MEYILIILVVVAIIQLQYLIAKNPASRKLATGVKPILIDTSALMDGRILTAARTGFIPERLVIPKSVVAELQLLADQADSDKRTRARHGLDVISELRAMTNVKVEIHDDDSLTGGVDERLVELAKLSHGAICTIDFNLNKVAKANGLEVLNLNELAQSIRMAFLPGESVSISLQQKGQDAHQAVGYLADGTMVVVERAAKHLGKIVEVEFIRSLQTAAGRMMFAKLAKADEKAEPSAEERGNDGADKQAKQTSRSTGRKPASRAKRQGKQPTEKTAVNTEPSSEKTPSSAQPASANQHAESPERTQKPRRRNTRQKRTVEDSLIDLVNSQSGDKTT